MDKLHVKNNFYDLELTSFITSIKYARSIDVEHAGYSQIVSYWRVFSLEENYQGKWNLEIFDRWMINRTKTITSVEELMNLSFPPVIIWTYSHTATENITKQWTFTNASTFTVEITRTYLISGENTNNQIIIDVNNHGIHPIQQGIVYETEVGVFGYKILEATPNNITIQTGHPTETQLNFYGASDRTLRYHAKGEVETVKLLVYANQFGSVNDVSW